jgi:diguanylate cyclase (GGDEF)-like protein
MDFNVDSTRAECARHSAPYALLMLDVDNFKKFNDRCGHPAGDSCLRAVAGAIETAVVETNIEGPTKDAFTARYGGEEFAVVIPDSSQAAYERIAMRVLAAVRNLHIPHEENAAWGLVTVSVGGNRIAAVSGATATLFRDADAALNRAKENGRNRCELGL